MLKRLLIPTMMVGLLVNPVVAAARPAVAASPARQEISPASEAVTGQEFWESASPILIFLLVVAIGTGIALLVNPNDKPASP